MTKHYIDWFIDDADKKSLMPLLISYNSFSDETDKADKALRLSFIQ